MSRIGKKPIEIPKGVEVKFAAGVVNVKGPKGSIQKPIHKAITVGIDGGVVKVATKDPLSDALTGITRTIVSNMITGVTTGFSKSLSLVGVGYRAAPKGKGVTLNLGHSHPIEFDPPQGIDIKVDKQTTLVVSGVDKQTVGEVAATLRGMRPPEPYHGKGVRYSDEVIVTKVGKAAGKK
jgi:large subunit ribosomal protein L6